MLYHILNDVRLIPLQKGTECLFSIFNMSTRRNSALSEEEHEELVKEYKENMNGTKHIARPSPRGRIQDFSNTVRNIIMLVRGLL